jgi:hypothetical protein
LALRPLLKFALVNRPELSFPRFWGPYPRKEARKDALKAWCELDPDEALIVGIVDSLGRLVPYWASMPWYTPPLPATFLRSERWTDEPPPQVNAAREQKRQQGSAWIQSIMRDREGKM